MAAEQAVSKNSQSRGQPSRVAWRPPAPLLTGCLQQTHWVVHCNVVRASLEPRTHSQRDTVAQGATPDVLRPLWFTPAVPAGWSQQAGAKLSMFLAPLEEQSHTKGPVVGADRGDRSDTGLLPASRER